MIIPVILSGGAGTRLWPVSRQSHPKPFIKLPDGKSLLHKTFERICKLNNISEIITLTNQEYYLKCKSEYEQVANQHTHHFLLEPFSRNTAPAIILAALKANLENGPDTILLVLPADHLISNQEKFTQACEIAYQLAKCGKIATFGIKPLTPETGFGYIECGDTLFDKAFKVNRFTEKPSLDIAEKYLQCGRYLWNAGMFCFSVKHLLEELREHASELLEQVMHCWHETLKHNSSPALTLIDKTSFNDVENISIDYALMEKSKNVAVVKCEFDWQDIGSWKAYKNLHEHDGNGNTILGDAILIDSQDNFIHGEGRMIASVGINNLFIIDTPDALLISHRDRSQDVSHIVKELKNTKHDSYLNHRTMLRPWGSYTILEEGEMFKIKRIVIKPQARLSLQSHQHRSEHWVVVLGTATIINGDKEYTLRQNESTFVPINTVHRISNMTNEDLIIIEVQSGSYLGEDDIIRYEDKYGRVS